MAGIATLFRRGFISPPKLRVMRTLMQNGTRRIVTHEKPKLCSTAKMHDQRTDLGSPFTRASSAGLAGNRTAACLRLEEPSSADPRKPDQRSEPEGPRSRGGLGGAGGNGHAFPPARREGERVT